MPGALRKRKQPLVCYNNNYPHMHFYIPDPMTALQKLRIRSLNDVSIDSVFKQQLN